MNTIKRILLLALIFTMISSAVFAKSFQYLAQIANKHSGNYKASYKTYNRIGTEN